MRRATPSRPPCGQSLRVSRTPFRKNFHKGTKTLVITKKNKVNCTYNSTFYTYSTFFRIFLVTLYYKLVSPYPLRFSSSMQTALNTGTTHCVVLSYPNQ